MKFLACEIHTAQKARYSSLLTAFRNSVEMNCPNDSVEVAYIDLVDYPDAYHVKNSYFCNSAKLMYWADKVATEKTNLCLIDGDTIVLKDMNHVFEHDFDIAFTKRSPGEPIPINGGVLFVRPSEKVTAFMREWSRVNNLMLKDVSFHRTWYDIYNGINQASFGYMLNTDHGLNIGSFPCRQYNACDPQDWANIDDNTHVIHIKSALREVCLLNMNVPTYKKATDLWRKYVSAREVSSSFSSANTGFSY